MIGSRCYLVLGALLSMLSLSAAWDFEPMSAMELLTAGREDSGGDGPRSCPEVAFDTAKLKAACASYPEVCQLCAHELVMEVLPVFDIGQDGDAQSRFLGTLAVLEEEETRLRHCLPNIVRPLLHLIPDEVMALPKCDLTRHIQSYMTTQKLAAARAANTTTAAGKGDMEEIKMMELEMAMEMQQPLSHHEPEHTTSENSTSADIPKNSTLGTRMRQSCAPSSGCGVRMFAHGPVHTLPGPQPAAPASTHANYVTIVVTKAALVFVTVFATAHLSCLRLPLPLQLPGICDPGRVGQAAAE
jgi:hypothetical protein